MEYKFSGKNLKECITKAESEFSKDIKELKYKIIKEEKGFLGRDKVCEIIVTTKDEEEKNDINLKEEVKEEVKEEIINDEDSKNIEVTDDTIIINQENLVCEIYFDPDIRIMVNDKKIQNGEKISSKDKITYECSKKEASRTLNIKATQMEARISIKYIPSLVPKLSCRIVNGNLRIKKRMVEDKKPPLYTRDELIEALKEKNIVFGYDEEGLRKATTEYTIENEIIAKGIRVIDDEDDTIEMYFEGTKRNVSEESKEDVDYRNMYSVSNVCVGDTLAELKIGNMGNDGTDIYGKSIAKKLKKVLTIQSGQGCRIEDNKVIAIMDGQPSVKNGMFFVHKVLQKTSDVDLKTGNIKFTGDVKINGSVRTGMTVDAGNSLEISGSIEESTIIAQGETRLNGSLINSKAIIGSKDLSKQNYMEALEVFTSDILELIKSLEELKGKQSLSNTSDGQLVKVLMETKFKSLQKKAFMVLNFKGEINGEKIGNFIRHKIIGAGPLKIKFTSELYELVQWLQEEVVPLKEELFIPVDIYLTYCQDSNIECTGSIYITGKGQYTSELNAKMDIIFKYDKAVSRGGTLIANRNIEAKVIGSPSGVATTLKVPKTGNIKADIAYHNTIFWFGDLKYVLEVPSKQINAFVNYEGEIVVEKFIL